MSMGMGIVLLLAIWNERERESQSVCIVQRAYVPNRGFHTGCGKISKLNKPSLRKGSNKRNTQCPEQAPVLGLAAAAEPTGL